MSTVTATGQVTLSITAVEPAINWWMNGHPDPIPQDVSWLVAAAIVTLGHLIFSQIMKRLNVTPADIADPTSQT